MLMWIINVWIIVLLGERQRTFSGDLLIWSVICLRLTVKKVIVGHGRQKVRNYL